MHPKYKTTYRVGNWAEYDRALVRRGDVTLWLTPDAIATWAAAGVGRRSGQLQYSDLAIETALTLSLIFHLPLRQTEGFLTSIFGMLGVDLTAPDHTTLSRRGQHLALALRRARPGTSLHLIVDSTGLSIVGDGEWAAAKHGGRGRRGWRKLHLGVDGSRVIVACALTEPTADDAITGIRLVDEVDGHLTRVTADPAYDTLAFYGAAGARGARVVVPPTKTASLSRRGARSGARDRTIRRVKALGRRRWKKASGYHQHARVENAFFRYKSIVGDCLRARSSSGQRREAVLACNVLNRMTELGRPRPIRISGRRESGIAACPALVEFDQRFIQMQILDHRTHLEVEPLSKHLVRPVLWPLLLIGQPTVQHRREQVWPEVVQNLPFRVGVPVFRQEVHVRRPSQVLEDLLGDISGVVSLGPCEVGWQRSDDYS